ncbi:unnamed protein product [Hermetia illucens]|uniref:F-box domain-containing protein n=1 Tax=Hermetia illucens TaxID=343691 RepID=A0A7R8Z0I5_HERIL|nr:uncharacterized protein LOC119654209 isoform X2 [Hermetia illucens]CAD7088771.1 unnamed protein product [Hermetia illucens]
MATAEAFIPALDEYCLEHIFSFLEILDQLNVAKVCLEFKTIIKRLIVNKEFDFNTIYECTSLPFAIETFTEYGSIIKKIFMQFDAVEDMVPFYYLVPEHCHNIEEVQFNFPYYVDDEIMEMMFKASKNIKVLFCNARELYDGHSLFISELKELEALNIKENRDVTGMHLNKLTKLKDLNIQGCTEFESKHFIDICKATKLTKLNITECLQLDGAAFETLLETQTDLEEIGVSHCYPNANIDIVTRLPKLRHVFIKYLCQRNGIHKESDLINLLAKYHPDSIDTLVMTRPENLTKALRGGVLKFKNLRKVSFLADEDLDDAFLSEISRNCTNLEEVDISESENVTNEGIIELVKNLQGLRRLDLRRCDQFDQSLYAKLIEVKTECNDFKHLKVFVWGTQFNQREFESCEKYLSFKKFVEVSFDFKY